MSFAGDLVQGEEFEQLVADTIRDEFDMLCHKNSDITGIDLVGECNIEVKLDRRYQDTGNFFVEFTFKGEPSGVQKYKECNYFVMGDKEFFVIMNPKILADFCRKNGKGINAGDGWQSKGYLIRVDEVKAYAEFVFENTL